MENGVELFQLVILYMIINMVMRKCFELGVQKMI